MAYESLGVPLKAFAITPNDSADLSTPVREIFVGTGGDLKVLHTQDSIPVTYKNVASGTTIAGLIKRVYNDGTTASDLIGRV